MYSEFASNNNQELKWLTIIDYKKFLNKLCLEIL